MNRRKEEGPAADDTNLMEKYLFVYHTQTLLYSFLGESGKPKIVFFPGMDAGDPEEQIQVYRSMVQFQNTDAGALRILTFHFLQQIRRMKETTDKVRAYEAISLELSRICRNRAAEEAFDIRILEEEIEHAGRCRERILEENRKEMCL